MKRFKTLSVLCGLILGCSVLAQDSFEPHGAMLRFPDVNQTHVVFLYGNDLWQVPREGGAASLLAAPAGIEQMPRYSPDGKTIAFMGRYDGNVDLYTISAAGGIPKRVTHHPGTENLDDWTPDGKSLLFFSGSLSSNPRVAQAFKVSATGGLPQKMPVPYGARQSLSGDGVWLAYTPYTRDQRTWKRYRGGMATDIWLFNLKDMSSKKLTDWEGTDTFPMWHGNKVYYLSDEGESHRLNIWMADPASGERRQITNFSDYDVKYPAIGPGPKGAGEIVFQHASGLKLVDLSNGQTRDLKVSISGARPSLRTQLKKTGDMINAGHISPSGKRVVVEARGEIWSLPAAKGSARNLTATNGVAERDPSFSPDGKWIAYFSDETGEYQMYVRPAVGAGNPVKITDLNAGFLFSPTWSPDSKHIAFTDKAGKIYLSAADASTTKEIYQDLAGNQLNLNWSPDSRWITFATNGENLMGMIMLYNVPSEKITQVTAGMYNDSWPTFDREGKYLYFASNRDITNPIYEDLGSTWIYTQTDRLFMVPLRRDVKSPFLAESDEEAVEKKEDKKDADESKKDKDKKGKRDKADEKKDDEKGDESWTIDLDGFEARAILLPVERGSFGLLAVNQKNQLIYRRNGINLGNNRPSIKIFDASSDKPEEKTVLDGSGFFMMSADGKKLIVNMRGDFAVINAGPEQKVKEKVPTDGMVVSIDPRQEWRQMFHDAWRLFRDYFYDPTMHGVDWKGVRDQYAAMLDDCVTREDLTYVIQEMISEINVGHAYYRFGGDYESTPRESVGLLGVDFALENGAYRFAKIYKGAPWDAMRRNPLLAPGVDVAEGDYLLAVNGMPLNTSLDPWAAFQGMGGHTVTLRVSKDPVDNDNARDVIVQTLRGEQPLRYIDFVERKRAYVEERTGGKVGYIYVENTGIPGQNALVRQFFGQTHKDALIIDERWNGGGQIPTRFIELLNRPLANMWAIRDGQDFKWPYDAHNGPKCMLINGRAGSGGDYFPYWFKASGLGKLIGTRTWGGLVGISGNPGLIDGARIAVPTFAFYEADSTWGIEGHGVDPDIEVIDDPALMVDGGDPQLDAAIAHMLQEIKNNPWKRPPRPAYPDRSGMGIKEEDK